MTFFLGDSLPEGAALSIDGVRLTACSDRNILTCDVGNLIFDNEALCGVKVWEESELDAQGEYWYDEARHVLKIYSASCPAGFYSDIECALRAHIIDQSNTCYVTYEQLAFKYGAAHGVGGANTHHTIVRDCDFGYIGGGDQMGGDRTVRYGNGIEYWANAHDNLVERCRLWEVYDAALTNQGSGTNIHQYNLVYRNNVIWNCEYSFEYWNRPENSETHNIVFENNTCINAGHGWGHAQRPDPSGRQLCFYTSPALAKDIYIRNNIFFEAKENAFYVPTWPKEAIDALIMDHNCWYQAEGAMLSIDGKSYTMAQFAAYQAEYAKEPHSICAEPGLDGDFRLTASSPCIDAGMETDRKADFDGTEVPQGPSPDLGAHEFSGPKPH